MRILSSITYDGSKFYGFQKLNKHKTIQGELEKVLSKINKQPVQVKGAGRTDRGAHALNQIIHFDLDIDIDEEGLKSAMNSFLDEGIYINHTEITNENFHARFDASDKTYEYVINLGEYDPLINDYAYNYNKKLNIKAMKKAIKYFLGVNSYKAFVTGTNDKCNSTIYKVKIKRKKDILVIRFIGKTFYNHMVRNMVGALLLVGQEKIKPIGINEMLLKERNVHNYSTLPACGLYLVDIEY